jgi:hypothetical protein
VALLLLSSRSSCCSGAQRAGRRLHRRADRRDGLHLLRHRLRHRRRARGAAGRAREDRDGGARHRALRGLRGAIFGDVFFTGQWLFLGATEDDKGLPLSTVLIFDVGVYLVVMGSILSLTFALEESV